MGMGAVWPVAGPDMPCQHKRLKLSTAMPGRARWDCRRRTLKAAALLMGLGCVLEVAPVAEERLGFRAAARCGTAKCSMHGEPRWEA